MRCNVVVGMHHGPVCCLSWFGLVRCGGFGSGFSRVRLVSATLASSHFVRAQLSETECCMACCCGCVCGAESRRSISKAQGLCADNMSYESSGVRRACSSVVCCKLPCIFLTSDIPVCARVCGVTYPYGRGCVARAAHASRPLVGFGLVVSWLRLTAGHTVPQGGFCL